MAPVGAEAIISPFRVPSVRMAGLLARVGLVSGIMVTLLTAAAHGAGTWFATGSLVTGRYHDTRQRTLTVLPSGKVLVAGGQPGASGVLASAELYDPATGHWGATGSLATARVYGSATLLPNGKVLVVGGQNTSGNLASAELYDPGTGLWSATGSLASARYNHTATLLPNGKVLVAGGFGNFGLLASAELYDPATGLWSATGSLTTARQFPTATLLLNGKVLVAGGSGPFGYLASAELYDPASGTWSATGSLATVRGDDPTATLLPNGKVLVTGGFNSVYLASAEVYDPASGLWSATGSLATAREYHTATLLPSGQVLVAGGYNGGLLASAELYDPTTGLWSATGALVTATFVADATLLPNGKVLVAGGNIGSAAAELYDPAAHTITATPGAGGTISPAGANLPDGGSQTFDILPVHDFKIDDVVVDGTSIGAQTTYTFVNVTADHTISASFSRGSFTIAANPGAGGTINPAGADVPDGGSQTFDILPDGDFEIDDVAVDGTSIGAQTAYTFANVTADHTISASFSLIPVPNGTVLIGYGPNTPNGSYLNAQSIADTQVFTTVRVQADSSIEIVDDLDLAQSIYGMPQYDLTLLAPVVRFRHHVHLSAIATYFLTDSVIDMNATLTSSAGGSIDPSHVRSTATRVNVLDDTASIQQAIDLSSPTLPVTVQVSAGQYHENLTIRKVLTLSGDPGSTIGAGASAPLLIGTEADSSIIAVNANDVTIEGLRLTAGITTGVNSGNGVSAGSVDGLIIRHNTLGGFAGSGLSVPVSATLDSNLTLVTAVDAEPLAGRLAIGLAGPHPATRRLSFDVTLLDREPARLELCDVQGRRVASRDLSALGPGHHVVGLDGGAGWRAGIYFATVVQGAHRAGMKVVALR